MNDIVPDEITTQLTLARKVIERHLASTLMAVHLYGSTVDGGLRPDSDIDLLVTVAARPNEAVRQALLMDLLDVSAPPGHRECEGLRPLEVTVVIHDDVVPWRYPARREMQFGEWLRVDITAGIVEPACVDADLAILLTKARAHGVALIGPAPDELFDPVPAGDFVRALTDTLKLWNSPPDWAGDERNVVLTLARIWYSAATGTIAPKDVAAEWAMERLPVDLQPFVLEARRAYLGWDEDHLASRSDQLTAFVQYVKREAAKLLSVRARGV